MTFSQSMAIGHQIKNVLESMGIEPEVAAHIGSVAGFYTAEISTEHHNSEPSKMEAIFSQIDLAQARINKDSEEIEVLAKETDDILNQLEYKAS